jgi:hypothetical protein
MKIEDQVCSFEQAKKLIDLGVVLDTTYYYYTPDGYMNERKLIHCDYVPSNSNGYPYYPAPNVAELGVLIPKFVSIIGPDDELWESCMPTTYWFDEQWNMDFQWFETWESIYVVNGETEAQARAEALIWLINNNYIIQGDLKL